MSSTTVYKCKLNKVFHFRVPLPLGGPWQPLMSFDGRVAESSRVPHKVEVENGTLAQRPKSQESFALTVFLYKVWMRRYGPQSFCVHKVFSHTKSRSEGPGRDGTGTVLHKSIPDVLSSPLSNRTRKKQHLSRRSTSSMIRRRTDH
jgi:hypothetical protein